MNPVIIGIVRGKAAFSALRFIIIIVPPDIVQNYSMKALTYVNVFRIVQFFLKKVFTNHIKLSIIQIETTRKQ